MRRSVLFLSLLFLICLLSLIVSSNSFLISPKPSPTPTAPLKQNVLGIQTKTTDCIIRGALPDSDCTPGAVIPDVTTDQICTSGYSASVRDVPDSVKKQVYAEYGIYSHFSGEYEVDHLISLELGGSNDISNLWPEAAEPRPGFHEKDQVENFLHREVCQGLMTLGDAQNFIAHNWLSVIVK